MHNCRLSSTLSFQLILAFNVNLYGLSAYWERLKYQRNAHSIKGNA